MCLMFSISRHVKNSDVCVLFGPGLSREMRETRGIPFLQVWSNSELMLLMVPTYDSMIEKSEQQTLWTSVIVYTYTHIQVYNTHTHCKPILCTQTVTHSHTTYVYIYIYVCVCALCTCMYHCMYVERLEREGDTVWDRQGQTNRQTRTDSQPVRDRVGSAFIVRVHAEHTWTYFNRVSFRCRGASGMWLIRP